MLQTTQCPCWPPTMHRTLQIIGRKNPLLLLPPVDNMRHLKGPEDLGRAWLRTHTCDHLVQLSRWLALQIYTPQMRKPGLSPQGTSDPACTTNSCLLWKYGPSCSSDNLCGRPSPAEPAQDPASSLLSGFSWAWMATLAQAHPHAALGPQLTLCPLPIPPVS